MSRQRNSVAVVVAWVVVQVFGLTGGRLARASGINDAWAGASASATYYDQSDSQQGATAAASASGTHAVEYLGRFDPHVFHAVLTGSLSADAGDSAARLLHVSASDNSPNPGQLGGPSGGENNLANASWTGDSVVLRAAPGSSLLPMSLHTL